MQTVDSPISVPEMTYIEMPKISEQENKINQKKKNNKGIETKQNCLFQREQTDSTWIVCDGGNVLPSLRRTE